MFIEIKSYDTKSPSIKMIESITSLIRSHHNSKNIVFGDLEIFRHIVKSDTTYGIVERSAAQQIIDSMREYASIKNTVKIYIIVDYNSDSSVLINELPGQTIYNVGWKYFSLNDNTQESAIVTENANDYKLYCHIAKYYLSKKRLGDVAVSLDNRPGGGSGCASIFYGLKQSKIAILGIIDSDKKHPSQGYGATLKSFNSSDIKNNTPATIYVTDGLEAENYIPLGLIERIFLEKSQQKIGDIDIIKEIFEENPEKLSHFDLKNGMCKREMINLDQVHGNFWNDLLKKMKTPSLKKCIDCAEPECFAVPNACQNIVEMTNNWLDENNINYLDKVLTEPLKTQWLNLGDLLWSWGCAISMRRQRH